MGDNYVDPVERLLNMDEEEFGALPAKARDVALFTMLRDFVSVTRLLNAKVEMWEEKVNEFTNNPQVKNMMTMFDGKGMFGGLF